MLKESVLVRNHSLPWQRSSFAAAIIPNKPFVTVSRSIHSKQKPLHRRKKGRLGQCGTLQGSPHNSAATCATGRVTDRQGGVIATMLPAFLQTCHCAQLEVTKNWDYNGRREVSTKQRGLANCRREGIETPYFAKWSVCLRFVQR